MALSNICLTALLFFTTAVLADFEQDIENAVRCAERYVISIKDVSQEVMECYKNTLPNMDNANINSFERIVKTACGLDDPKFCVMEHTNFFRHTCLTGDLQKKFETVMTRLALAYKIACRDEGAKIIEFIKNDGIDCVQTLMNDPDGKVLHCVENLVNASKDDLLRSAEDDVKIHELECKFGYQTKGCLMAGLTSCTKAGGILDDFLNELLQNSDCDAFAPSPHHRNGNHRQQASAVFTLFLSFVTASKFHLSV